MSGISQTFDEAMEAHVRNVLDQMLMGTENYFGATDPKREGRIRIAHGLIVREIVEQAQKAAAAEREACAKVADERVNACWIAHTQFGTGVNASMFQQIADHIRAREQKP